MRFLVVLMVILIVRVRVQPHTKFNRDGKDIFYDQDVSMVDAALGCEIVVPTLERYRKNQS